VLERGTQKWGLGPSVVALATPGPWVVGSDLEQRLVVRRRLERAERELHDRATFLNYNFPVSI